MTVTSGRPPLEHESFIAAVKQGLCDVDDGKVLEHAEAMAWVRRELAVGGRRQCLEGKTVDSRRSRRFSKV